MGSGTCRACRAVALELSHLRCPCLQAHEGAQEWTLSHPGEPPPTHTHTRARTHRPTHTALVTARRRATTTGARTLGAPPMCHDGVRGARATIRLTVARSQAWACRFGWSCTWGARPCTHGDTQPRTHAHARQQTHGHMHDLVELAVAATGPHVRVHADVLDGSEPGVCAFPRHDRPRGLVDLKEARTACSPGIAVPVTIDALGIAACGHGRSGSDAGGRDLSHGSRTRSSRQAWELRGGCSRGKPQRSVCWQHAAHVARLGSCGRLLSR